MNKVKIASPLYIVRDECEKDLFLVLEKLKKMNFDGIEFLGFFGKNPIEIREKLDTLGLEALGNHVDYQDFANNIKEIIDIHKIIGCKYITITGLDKEQLSHTDELSNYLETVKKISRQCREEGITLLYHNHDKELQVKYNGKFALEHILDNSSTDLCMEPDLGWMLIGGGEPREFLDKYKDRCPVIHLKDFYAEEISKIGNVAELEGQKGDEKNSFFEFRPVGYGIFPTPALFKKILACNPEWIVADHDLAYERDSYEDLKLSLEYIRNLLLIQ